MKFTFNTLLLAVLLFSCTTEKPQNNEIQEIELIDSNDILPLSSFADNLSYTRLRVPDNVSSIGNIEKIKVLNAEIFVFQRKADERSIVRFTNSGEFISVVSSNKKDGVNYPLDIIRYKNDFAVLAKSGIYVFSGNGKKKQHLINAEMPGCSFFHQNLKFYVLNDFSVDELLTEYPVNGNAVTPAKTLAIGNEGLSCIYQQGKGKQFVATALNDTIFSVNKKGLEARYILASNGTTSYMNGMRSVDGADLIKTKKYLRNNKHLTLKNFLENSHYIYATYWIGSKGTTLIQNKQSNAKLYFAHALNNMDGGIWDRPFYLSENDELYVPIEAMKVSCHTIKHKKNREFEDIQRQLAGSNDPLIMKLKLNYE